jgi:hypothetical protein
MKIVDRIPYYKTATELTVKGESLTIKPYQIIVWVSVGEAGNLQWDSRTPVFPAIFDPGNNHNFSIYQSHLERWAGLVSEHLPVIGTVRERGVRRSLHAAVVWLHRNRRGTRDIVGQPYPIVLEEGIALFPDEEEKAPHLPLLGLRGLTDNKLVSIVDGARKNVTIQTARPWWWPFAFA